MNQPVFGVSRERIITASELMGEGDTAPASTVGSPEALQEFIKIGAAVQKKEREARGV